MTVRAVVPAPRLPDAASAQALIDAHLRSDAAGHCHACREIAPCHFRALAHAALLRAGLLPQRRPGLTQGDAATFDAFSERR